ncbi:MAG: GntR family transcriptional regulator [Lachnospiraceae bacterium]|nr:GntR family transcriptional regulator [Lachnospiraceae bacterium]
MSHLVKSTLSSQIYDILKEDIIQGTIKPGEKLTLKFLQERFQVSSTPIREALTRLTEDSLVTYYSNVGIRVVELTKGDLEEIYQFIGDLDSIAIRYAYDNGNYEAMLKDMTDNITDSQKYLQIQDTKNWILCSDSFHLIAYNYCGNKRLLTSAEKMRGQLTIMSASYEQKLEYQEKIQKEHEEIYELIEAHNIAEAQKKMKEHLNHSLSIALENRDA